MSIIKIGDMEIAMNAISFSRAYIDKICDLYGDIYDDRLENTHPPTAGKKRCIPGEDWCPGIVAGNKSLAVFRRELKEQGIELSTSKIKKILITGGRWTTQRSRGIQESFYLYTRPVSDNGRGMTEAEAIRLISRVMRISIVSVSVNLPYRNVVYNLENRSSNALRCAKYKARKRGDLV